MEIKRRYDIWFPRWQEDIVSMRRTLVHLICTDDMHEPHEGDTLLAVPHPDFPRGIAAVITNASQVRLIDSLTLGDGDWEKLNLAPSGGFDTHADRECARVDYWARWDAVNPDTPCATNPLVWRITFRYGHADPESPSPTAA